MADHSLWLWKENILYRIDNVPENEKQMLNERVMDDVQKVYGLMDGYAILKTDNSLWMIGNNDLGQLGVDPSQLSHALEPIQVNLEPVDVGTIPWDTSGYVDDPDFSGQSEAPEETYPEAYAAYAQVLEERAPF